MASGKATLEGIRKHLEAASNIIQPLPEPLTPSKKSEKKKRGAAAKGGDEIEQVQQQPRKISQNLQPSALATALASLRAAVFDLAEYVHASEATSKDASEPAIATARL